MGVSGGPGLFLGVEKKGLAVDRHDGIVKYRDLAVGYGQVAFPSILISWNYRQLHSGKADCPTVNTGGTPDIAALAFELPESDEV